jgi:hypothetical protein
MKKIGNIDAIQTPETAMTNKNKEILVDGILRRVVRVLLLLLPILIMLDQVDDMIFYWIAGMTTSALVATIIIQTTPQ